MFTNVIIATNTNGGRTGFAPSRADAEKRPSRICHLRFVNNCGICDLRTFIKVILIYIPGLQAPSSKLQATLFIPLRGANSKLVCKFFRKQPEQLFLAPRNHVALPRRRACCPPQKKLFSIVVIVVFSSSKLYIPLRSANSKLQALSYSFHSLAHSADCELRASHISSFHRQPIALLHKPANGVRLQRIVA